MAEINACPREIIHRFDELFVWSFSGRAMAGT
jgi:hypothetical protein